MFRPREIIMTLNFNKIGRPQCRALSLAITALCKVAHSSLPPVPILLLRALLAHVRATRQCTPIPGERISHVHASFDEDPEKLPPNGYRKEQFPPDIARQFILDGIPENNVYYLIQDDPGDYHWCPIGECGEYFLGHDIRTHLRDYHKNINSRSRDIIKCTVKSSESSRCWPGSEVQGRNFEKHFREVHVDHHFLCPFCQGRQKRVLQFKKHFRSSAMTVRLEELLDRSGYEAGKIWGVKLVARARDYGSNTEISDINAGRRVGNIPYSIVISLLACATLRNRLKTALVTVRSENQVRESFAEALGPSRDDNWAQPENEGRRERVKGTKSTMTRAANKSKLLIRRTIVEYSASTLLDTMNQYPDHTPPCVAAPEFTLKKMPARRHADRKFYESSQSQFSVRFPSADSFWA
ncbi:hypothetical protein ARMSODRAFT_978975 [Armillaria solidipes]|uniref:Uncharacterized protein n=1 Tax=Armillaria solidipes TaxID=1076256 RepID=A0A2H3BJK8_9AGAR|nr:hypothetical protein ARMSODRAFT_978975 [Armillaria solidipes]